MLGYFKSGKFHPYFEDRVELPDSITRENETKIEAFQS